MRDRKPTDLAVAITDPITGLGHGLLDRSGGNLKGNKRLPASHQAFEIFVISFHQPFTNIIFICRTGQQNEIVSRVKIIIVNFSTLIRHPLDAFSKICPVL